MGVIKLDDPSGLNAVGKPLPNHSDKGVNAVVQGGSKRIKADVIEEHAVSSMPRRVITSRNVQYSGTWYKI
ncbi:hypothetical protein GOBAR_DD28429 [Gossypium barbadense]|nr:hypothetical protein GOBAR_DD28429 [Gossypium barbadense]